MDSLNRGQAPFSAELWKAIDDAVGAGRSESIVLRIDDPKAICVIATQAGTPPASETI